MAKKKGLTTPIILLVIAGIVLFCCFPSAVLGTLAVVNFDLLDSIRRTVLDENPGGFSSDTDVPEAIQDTPVEIDIISSNEFSQSDSMAFMQEIISDKQFQPLYEWALAEEYLQIENEVGGGAEVIYSDGSVLRGIVHGEVQILQLGSSSQTANDYILSRYEGTDEDPIWIIFNQDGSAHIDESGISVFDLNGDPIGNSTFSMGEDGIQLTSLSPIAATKCTTTGWDEFVGCIRSQGSPVVLGSVCAVSIGAAKVACVVGGAFTLGGSCIVAIGGAAIACGIVPAVCLKPALHDDWPEASISMWSDTGEKKWVSGGLAPGATTGAFGWIEATVWKAKLTVTDDREPAPKVEPPLDWITVGSGECKLIRIEDCGENIIEKNFCAPEPTSGEMSTWQEANPFPGARSSDPLPPEPTEKSEILPIEISYAGRYTSVMSGVYGSGVLGCSTNEDYWSDVVFTYRFNADDTVTLTSISVDGEVQTDGAWKIDYIPGDNNTYVNSYTTDNGFWKVTLYFSNTDLRIEKYHQGNDGTSGTCVITLQVVQTP